MAPTNSKVSYDSIITVMDLLKDPKMTFSSVASFTGLSESTIVRIFDGYYKMRRAGFMSPPFLLFQLTLQASLNLFCCADYSASIRYRNVTV